MEEWGETRRQAWDAWDCEGGWENSEICQDAMPSGTQPSPAPCENFKGQDISQIICQIYSKFYLYFKVLKQSLLFTIPYFDNLLFQSPIIAPPMLIALMDTGYATPRLENALVSKS